MTTALLLSLGSIPRGGSFSKFKAFWSSCVNRAPALGWYSQKNTWTFQAVGPSLGRGRHVWMTQWEKGVPRLKKKRSKNWRDCQMILSSLGKLLNMLQMFIEEKIFNKSQKGTLRQFKYHPGKWAEMVSVYTLLLHNDENTGQKTADVWSGEWLMPMRNSQKNQR